MAKIYAFPISGQRGPKLLEAMFSLKHKARRVRTSSHARDTQRGRVYKADAALRPFDRVDVSTVPLIERYVAKIWTSKRVQDAWPKATGMAPPQVKNGQGRRRAGGNSALITMPLWARKEGIVLHEIAHTITARTHPWSIAPHGWQYCEVYLTLVLYMMGREAHDALKAAFKANRVRFTKPRIGRQLTPEQRAAAIARLSVYNGTAATETLDATREE